MAPMTRTRLALLATAALAAGGLSAVGVASAGDDSGSDDVTGTRTTGTGTTGTTTTAASGRARAPRIEDIEVDAADDNRLRLRAEVEERGARVTRVTFRYRGRTFRARRDSSGSSDRWQRTVRARGGDGDGDVVRVRVRACARTRCTVRTGSDEA